MRGTGQKQPLPCQAAMGGEVLQGRVQNKQHQPHHGTTRAQLCPYKQGNYTALD